VPAQCAAGAVQAMITLDLFDEDAVTRAKVSNLRPFLARARKAVPIVGEVSVLLTSDSEIRRLNQTFRGKNKATDVLSFPAPALPKSTRKPAQQTIAGDLAISIHTAERQARQFGHPLEIELKILLLHGLLHLAGYDHETDAGEMADREDQLRRRFRLPGTLIARSSAENVAHRNGGRR
jgi:probable rRNA maturation factor